MTYLLLVACFTNGCAQVKNVPQSTHNSAAVHEIPAPVQTIAGAYDRIEIDALGNIYLLHEGQLKKLSPAGDSIAVFNDVKRFGQPSTLDVSNPFKILLYYKQYATVVLLDNMLANRGVINLRKAGIFSVNAMGTSYDGKLWLFDEQDFKLKKLNEDGTELLESNDLRQAASIAPQPTNLFDSEGAVYLYDSAVGFIQLDYYGTFIKTLPFTGWQSVSISKNILFGIKNGNLFSYRPGSLDLKEYKLAQVQNTIISVRVVGGKIYLHKKEGIEIYNAP